MEHVRRPAAHASAQKLLFASDSLPSSDTSNLFGKWCIGDSDLALMLNCLALNSDPVPAKLANYAQRQWERLSVQEWIALNPFEFPSGVAGIGRLAHEDRARRSSRTDAQCQSHRATCNGPSSLAEADVE
ncbi:hypothetical protein [Paraburkholderia lycopersici]|uniref:hypothetical protein n=1 Tax=Paraburkholderia lycopersici TaxID=416944 RepID=UPI001FDEB0EE|nr:hypothetical protein [Paraburkholderia lycopersici]